MNKLKYGRNDALVTEFIERCKVLTDDELQKIAVRSAAWDAAWDAAYSDARSAARESVRSAAWDAAWDAAGSAAWYVAGYAAGAIVVMDLITAEQFAILTEPFAEILTELGIVWEASKASK